MWRSAVWWSAAKALAIVGAMPRTARSPIPVGAQHLDVHLGDLMMSYLQMLWMEASG